MKERKCPFCPDQLAPIQDRILYEEKNVVVILSDPRLMEGHTLVVPRRHVASLLELIVSGRRQEWIDLWQIATHFQQILKKLNNPNGGCDIRQHDRPFMPKTKEAVPEHLHIHLLPRAWEDAYYQEVLRHERFEDLTPEEIKKIRARLAE